jgi:hypothetical protein
MAKRNRLYTTPNMTLQEETDMEKTQNDSVQENAVTEIVSQPVIKAPVQPVVKAPVQPVINAITQPVIEIPVQQEKEIVQRENTPPVDKMVTEIEHVKQINPIAKQAPVQSKVVSNTNEYDIVINSALNSVDQQTASINSFLDTYVKSMSAGMPIDSKKGGTNQFNLYSTIVQITGQDKYDDFKRNLVLLLAYMRKYETTCFSERLIFRFAEEWPSSTDKLTHFHATLNLFKIIANPKERPVNKYVNLERTFNTGFSEIAKDNITKFIER